MGWWSCDVLGGDTPLDMMYDVEEALGINELYPFNLWSKAKREKVATAINRNWLKLLDAIATYKKDDEDFLIAIQVTATVVMAAGANMPEDFKKVAIQAGENDHWAQEDSEREAAMDKYIEALKEYNDSPRELEHTGLLDRFAEVLGG